MLNCVHSNHFFMLQHYCFPYFIMHLHCPQFSSNCFSAVAGEHQPKQRNNGQHGFSLSPIT